MSGAAQAAETLKNAAKQAYLDTFECGSRFAKAHVEVRKSSDIIEVMSAMIELIVYAHDLHDAAERACKSLRQVLAETMDATGATSIQSEHHGAHLARKPAFVSIGDEALIPPEYVTMRPTIDKRAIAQALKDGAQVPGCSMAYPNEMTLVLRAKKEAA